MPVFSLFDQAPDMAPPDQCYVAETAIVIGKVRIKAGARIPDRAKPAQGCPQDQWEERQHQQKQTECIHLGVVAVVKQVEHAQRKRFSARRPDQDD